MGRTTARRHRPRHRGRVVTALVLCYLLALLLIHREHAPSKRRKGAP